MAPFHEFLDQLVAEHFCGRGRLHELREQFRGCFGFFDALGQFGGGGEGFGGVVPVGVGAVVVVVVVRAGEVVLLLVDLLLVVLRGVEAGTGLVVDRLVSERCQPPSVIFV